MTIYTGNIKIAGNGVKKNIPWDCHGMSNIPGGDEGIRTLDTLASIPHFQCGALDQLCDVSGYLGLRVIQRLFLGHQPQHHLRHLRPHLLLHQPTYFPIRHQFRATLGLRYQPPMFPRLFRKSVLPCTIE